MGLFTSALEVALVCLVCFAMVHVSHAQNSPQDFLNLHNTARAQVRVGPMTWDNTVAAFAQNYANRMAATCGLVHSGGPYGENISAGNGDFSTATMVNLWIAERPFYNYNTNSCSGGECLHYTQVVWRNSVRLGCARVRCNNGGTFVVCNYEPRGNIIGQRPY